MLGRRLFAGIIAGVLALSTIGANSVTAFATDDDEIIIFDDFGEDVEDFESQDDEDLSEAETDKVDEKVTDAEDDELTSDSEDDGEIIDNPDGSIYAVKFYPGEGKLIKSFNLCDDVSYWEYDIVEKVMTLYVVGSKNALQSLSYTLAVADGSREFVGWYYNEEYSQKAFFDRGIPLDSDVVLYARFVDTGVAYEDVPEPVDTSISFDLPVAETNPEDEFDEDLGDEGAPTYEDEDLGGSSYVDEDTGYYDATYDEDWSYEDEDYAVEDEDERFEEEEFDIDERDEELFAFLDIATSNLVVGGAYAKDFTGEAITYGEDELRVYYNGMRLQEGLDYKLSYANNKSAFVAPDNFEDLSDSEKAALNPPTVTITLKGNYSGTAEFYFDITPINIYDAYLASSGALTACYYDRSFAQNPVIKATLPDGKTVTLSSKTDYEIFYNKIYFEYGETIVDYDTELSAQEVAADVKECMEDDPDEDVFYLVNVRGKKNFGGILASEDDGTNWAPTLQVLSKGSVEANFLQLDDAKLSKKIAAQSYREDSKGKAASVSADVIKLFKDGEITVKIGRQKLTYVEDADAESTVTSEGYYFRIEDPAVEDEELNRFVGSDNYVTLVPTNIPEYNRLAGEYNAFFDIKGAKISIKSINTKLEYDGEYVLVYTDDNDGDGYLDVDTEATLERLNAVVIDSNKQILPTDRYTISTNYDRCDVGTVTVDFEGNPERGVTGIVSKNIKIVKSKLTANDVKVSFADSSIDPQQVPMDGGAATPGITVALNDGKRLVEDEDYAVSYSKNTTAGKTATVTVKFDGNYTGKVSNALTFTVAQQKLNSDAIEAEVADKVYKEDAGKNYFKSEPEIYNDGVKLKVKKDYAYADEPTYYYAEDISERDESGNIVYSRKAGTRIPDNEVVHAGALINVQFSIVPSSRNKNFTADKDVRGSYIPVEFTLPYRMGQMSISSAKIVINDQVYNNGNSVIPSKDDITVTIGSGSNAVKLEDDEYTIISVYNSEEVGNATIIIEGRGRFVGEKKATYKIVQSTITDSKK